MLPRKNSRRVITVGAHLRRVHVTSSVQTAPESNASAFFVFIANVYIRIRIAGRRKRRRSLRGARRIIRSSRSHSVVMEPFCSRVAAGDGGDALSARWRDASCIGRTTTRSGGSSARRNGGRRTTFPARRVTRRSQGGQTRAVLAFAAALAQRGCDGQRGVVEDARPRSLYGTMAVNTKVRPRKRHNGACTGAPCGEDSSAATTRPGRGRRCRAEELLGAPNHARSRALDYAKCGTQEARLRVC